VTQLIAKYGQEQSILYMWIKTLWACLKLSYNYCAEHAW